MSPRDLSAEGAVRTTCPYCGVGCGVLATPDGAGAATVQGDPDHPANFGRLCSKGAALGETVSLEGRLLAPRLHGRDASWDAAIGAVAEAFSSAIRDHGPDSVAIYGSGQLLTEDYYVANKFMKGFVGSANIDTNSRLCMASTVAGHKRAFGSDTVPGTYEDLEEADLVVLVGSNLAWCHPVLFQRLSAAKAARPGMKVINIDPRRTATSELADLQLSLAPGSDVALFNGLLAEIERRGALAPSLTHVAGLAEALEAARADDLSATRLAEAELSAFFDLWTGTEKVVTVFSQGVNQSAAGVDKVNAIINCHLATNRIGRPGMGPFSVTGQPNAMGGREVGGLSNMLACHLDLADPAHREAVQAHWRAPVIAAKPGLKAVDLFRACAEGRIKALWIMSTNPVVSMPEADKVAEAIKATPFVAVSDLFSDTDTAKLAHVVLPAAGWGEKSGTVTNSDRTISRQRPFLPIPGQTRPDWRIVSDVAAAMGWGETFSYDGPADVFREHAALSAVAAGLGSDFDISALADISDDDYEAMTPARWPLSASRNGGRFFADGRYHTPDGRARAVAVSSRPLAAPRYGGRPFVLNTGRVRDQWHTMTRTGRSARLGQHMAEPFVEIHPEDAAPLGLAPADLARVSTPLGEAVLRVLVTDRVRRGELFAPMHWTARFAARGRVNTLVGAEVDPISGQPELKGAPCAIEPFAPAWRGFIASKGAPPSALDAEYWALAPLDGGWRAELAGEVVPEDWASHARRLTGAEGALVELSDARRGAARLAFTDGGDVQAAAFFSRGPLSLPRGGVTAALTANLPLPAVLSGVAAEIASSGPTVCACFGVGRDAILAAIREGDLTTVAEVSDAAQAGGNCGSCIPEIARLLKETVETV